MNRSPEKTTKHLINLYEGDYATLGELYAVRRPASVIRQLVRNHIQKKLQQREEQSNVRQS